ncbi:hypothetical protein A2V82_10645 [candidate division KSB1 bacterium RBG_16_48_16]|nr:MAG: hypothetical protein A2V82_10645 [candidate division KSB1 bacterium RBG_16_48_16]
MSITQKNKNWFNRQPVSIRAALITSATVILVGIFSFISKIMDWTLMNDSNEKQIKYFDRSFISKYSYSKPELEPFKNSGTLQDDKFELLAFTLDTRHTNLVVEYPKNTRDFFYIKGNSYPVFICAFYNGTSKPKVISGVEVKIYHEALITKLQSNIILLEPFYAFNIYRDIGFQPFIPPMVIQPRKIAAIHLRLIDSPEPKIEMLCDNIYELYFTVDKDTIKTSKFRWNYCIE